MLARRLSRNFLFLVDATMVIEEGGGWGDSRGYNNERGFAERESNFLVLRIFMLFGNIFFFIL